MSQKCELTFKKGQEHRREFLGLFKKLCRNRSNWQVWQDFVYVTAAALSQPLCFRQDREDEYHRIIGKYDKSERELFPMMLGEIVSAFEQEKFADILGEMYMGMELGNHWRGQYFTPYSIASFMGAIAETDIAGLFKEKGYVTVGEPCCGSGALLIAFCESAVKQNVNYQQSVLFVARDIDPVAAQMCYIQMSLLGMAGYVIVGNSLLENFEPSNYWYTPMYFSKIWRWRRAFKMVNELTPDNQKPKEPVIDEYDIVLREGKNGQLSFAV